MIQERGFFIPVTLIVYMVMAFAALAVVGVLVYKVNHWCNAVCRDLTKERDELVKEKKDAQDRATALALKWADQVDLTEKAARAAEAARNGGFDNLVQRAGDVGAGAGIRLPAAAAGLFHDITVSANAVAPAAPSGGEKAAAPVPAAPTTDSTVTYDARSVLAYAALAGKAYADAVGQWLECVQFYEGLRAQEQTK